MPSEWCNRNLAPVAPLARRGRRLRWPAYRAARPFIHVNDRPMSIMIGIDETPAADHALRASGPVTMMMTTTPVVRARPARSPVDRRPSCCSSACARKKWTLRSSLAPRNVEMTASEAPFLLSAGVRQYVSVMASSKALYLKSRPWYAGGPLP